MQTPVGAAEEQQWCHCCVSPQSGLNTSLLSANQTTTHQVWRETLTEKYPQRALSAGSHLRQCFHSTDKPPHLSPSVCASLLHLNKDTNSIVGAIIHVFLKKKKVPFSGPFYLKLLATFVILVRWRNIQVPINYCICRQT